ncbi:MAG TPA: R3H domain-containing nucleic acid-binding protein [Thermoanaerobaculia bacterium]|nr:R3H domain-containing nucleic acid-binding protein [Thermoanaerobaculia bacterium]
MAHRFEGRNLEEALTNATQTLGVDRWQLTHHILLEKRGFLGGMKRVVIDVEVNADAAPPPPVFAPPVVTESARPVPPPARAPREVGRQRGGDRPRGGRGPRQHDELRSRPRRARREREDADELQTGDFEKFFEATPEQTAESELAQSVHTWCEQVLALAKFSLDVRTIENETQVIVRLYGGDARKLVENHGELLDAIQVLANKALVGRRIEKEIELDCGQFKDKRAEELAERAREVAERVRRGGREELLPAMTPIERRIVHLALHEDAEVTTESRGEGFYKRVAIVPRAASTES